MKTTLRPVSFLVLNIALVMLLMSCQVLPQLEKSLSPETSPIADLAQTSPAPTTTPGANFNIIPVQLPPLTYDYGALEPYIDARTMQLHHDQHHGTYVSKLNEAVQNYPDLQGKNVVDLLQNLNSLPEEIRTAVRNNGGGHLNHTMFWQIMAANAGGTPTGALAEAIETTFGSFDSFKQQFSQAGTNRFGSGWVWLVLNPQNQLQIISTANQDTPVTDNLYPILGNDVWEHAYYLQYQNRRAEYLDNWWGVVNWAEVDRRFAQASALQTQLTAE